ncbi:hypothetical protein XH81_12810 [Bradyrhizobium sp. CCBAU 25360]|uniref:hypothetical protein n=1 Tax=Bradyrhizobium sp. CCBAU 25360 TaxID=858425 RepID=UPI0023051A70|nr:hypothetical protein [Bradyrhizobium sp. CCBAU 25360]MDA9415716.1 hypothetical protein [Bradyrhizobium sp. CCBAU 25360]
MNSIVTLPIVTAAPTTAPLLHGLEDPVFAAIERHRRAMEALKAANAEQERVLRLADEMVGLHALSVLDMREPSNPPGWHPYVDAICSSDIENFVPRAEHQELHDHYQMAFAERRTARAKFVEEMAGDIDAMVNAPGEQEFDTAQELVSTSPTTLSGMLALLTYVGESREDGQSDEGITPTFDEENLTVLVETLARTAKRLTSRVA